MTTEATCPHHWILEPFKQEALGVCRDCGAEKLHKGGIDYMEFFGGPTNYRKGHRKESSMRGAAKGGKATGELWKGEELL